MSDRDDHDDQQLLAAYRALPRPEPPAALDAAVLAHARAALAASRPARPRWVAGLATAAVLTLAVGTGWQLREAPLGDGPLSPTAVEPDAGTANSAATVFGAVPAAVDAPREAEATLGASEQAALGGERSRESAARQNREERKASTQDAVTERPRVARQPAPAEAPLDTPAPATAVPAPAAAGAPAPATPPPPPAPPAPPVARDDAPAASAPSALRKASGRTFEDRPHDVETAADAVLAEPAPRAEGAPIARDADRLQRDEGRGATESAPGTLGPLEWLDAIRRMRDQGDSRRAADALAQFRAVYPDEPVPEDLKSLLR